MTFVLVAQCLNELLCRVRHGVRQSVLKCGHVKQDITKAECTEVWACEAGHN